MPEDGRRTFTKDQRKAGRLLENEADRLKTAPLCVPGSVAATSASRSRMLHFQRAPPPMHGPPGAKREQAQHEDLSYRHQLFLSEIRS
jgi:hypothetical protein